MGGENMTIKTVADRKSELLLGCQIVGSQGVDRRIDCYSTMLTLKGKVDDLISMDLAYAPPYSTPKDLSFILALNCGSRGNNSIVCLANV
jgi:pyruvate/2-oxoglutarate dehydrogenase complex dihydrolipoamide dehydrogenase (E3) component